MPERPIETRTLVRRTLVTVCAIVGAKVVVVGLIALVVALAVGGAPSSGGDNVAGGTMVPAVNVHGAPPGPSGAPAARVVPR